MKGTANPTKAIELLEKVRGENTSVFYEINKQTKLYDYSTTDDNTKAREVLRRIRQTQS